MQITEMNKKTATQISEEAMKALRDVAQKFGIEVQRGTGTYNNDEFKLKIVFKTPLKEKEVVSLDDSTIQCGLAERGMTVLTFDNKEVVIEDSKRTKYVFHYKDNPSKKFVGPFRMFKSKPKIEVA